MAAEASVSAAFTSVKRVVGNDSLPYCVLLAASTRPQYKLDTRSPADQTLQALPTVTVANKSGTALRESADAGSPLYYHYPAGTAVKVLGVGVSWCHVSIDGCAGFMRLSDLDPRLSFADSCQ